MCANKNRAAMPLSGKQPGGTRFRSCRTTRILWTGTSVLVSACMMIFAACSLDPPLQTLWDEVKKANTRIVTFNVDGGSSVASQTVQTGDTVEEPSAPTKASKHFGGWFKSSACLNDPWDFDNDSVDSNTTLYAKWVADTERVVLFYSMGGSLVPAAVVTKDTAASQPANPAKTGYVFSGWYEKDALSAYNFSTNVSDNIKLYAKWTIAVTGVTVTPGTWTLVSVGETIQLSAVVAPANATDKTVSWSSDASPVATVTSDGLVEAVSAGTATITVTTNDGNKTGTAAITVSINALSVKSGANPTGLTIEPVFLSGANEVTITLGGAVTPGLTTEAQTVFGGDPAAIFDSGKMNDGYSHVTLTGMLVSGKTYKITQTNQSLNLYQSVDTSNIFLHSTNDVYKETTPTISTNTDYTFLLWGGADTPEAKIVLEEQPSGPIITYIVEWGEVDLTP